MKPYKFTAFEPTGKLIIEETWEFASDEEAKSKGQDMIEENNNVVFRNLFVFKLH